MPPGRPRAYAKGFAGARSMGRRSLSEDGTRGPIRYAAKGGICTGVNESKYPCLGLRTWSGRARDDAIRQPAIRRSPSLPPDAESLTGCRVEIM